MTKKAEKTEPTPEIKSIEEMILNYPSGKYTAIPLAALWAKVLRKKEENRHLTPAEILDLSLRDVLSGSVDWKDLKKAMAAASDGASSDEKKK